MARPQSMRWQKRAAPATKPSAMRKLVEFGMNRISNNCEKGNEIGI